MILKVAFNQLELVGDPVAELLHIFRYNVYYVNLYILIDDSVFSTIICVTISSLDMNPDYFS